MHSIIAGLQSGRRSPKKGGRRILQVSRVKRLPIPAESTQLLGKEFVGEEGRGANLIDIFGGAVEVRGVSRSHRLGNRIGVRKRGGS